MKRNGGHATTRETAASTKAKRMTNKPKDPRPATSLLIGWTIDEALNVTPIWRLPSPGESKEGGA